MIINKIAKTTDNVQQIDLEKIDEFAKKIQWRN
jgi:hypothetical protein